VVVLPVAITDFLQFLEIVIWPVVVVAGICVLVSEPGRKVLKDLLSSVRRLKAFGVELELGSNDDARKLKTSLEDEFRVYREEVVAEFDRQARRFNVGRLLARVVEELVEKALVDPKNKEYRCTVYVEDIVFEHALYRLLDYYPGGDGKGSTYSSRFGIIGRSWRLEEPQGPTEVSDDREALINTWGMTREEAAGKQSARWYATYPLREGEKKPVTGLLYIESESTIRADLPSQLESAPSVVELTEAVEKAMENMRGRGPYLEFLGG
jgi:hypothetical protein